MTSLRCYGCWPLLPESVEEEVDGADVEVQKAAEEAEAVAHAEAGAVRLEQVLTVRARAPVLACADRFWRSILPHLGRRQRLQEDQHQHQAQK